MLPKFRFLLLCFMGGVLLFGFFTTFSPAYAESSIDKLPAPELVSVTYEDHSYDMPATTTTDPFTGKTVENPAYHVENRTLTIVINKRNINLDAPGRTHYIVGMKGSFSNEWTNITGWVDPNSDSPLTTLVFISPDHEQYTGTGMLYRPGSWFYLPYEGQADFQVCAEVWGEVMSNSPSNPLGGSKSTLFGVSGWSNIKTITMGQCLDDVVSNQQNSTPTSATDQSKSQSDIPAGELSLPNAGLVVATGITILAGLVVAIVYKGKLLSKP